MRTTAKLKRQREQTDDSSSSALLLYEAKTTCDWHANIFPALEHGNDGRYVHQIKRQGSSFHRQHFMIDIIDSKYVLGLKHTKPIPRAKHQKNGPTIGGLSQGLGGRQSCFHSGQKPKRNGHFLSLSPPCSRKCAYPYMSVDSRLVRASSPSQITCRCTTTAIVLGYSVESPKIRICA